MTTLRFPRGLYGITPEWPDTGRLLQAIETAHANGMAVLQWRRKRGAAPERLAQARAVRDLCARRGLPLIINDDWRLARELDADGVHLGKEDGAIGTARAALGPEKIIGCSCYNRPELAASHLEDHVDYIAFGAVYPSTIKPGAPHATAAHLQAGRRLAEAFAPPRPAVVAIGGLSPDNAAPIIDAGADSIALITALFEAPDIALAARQCAALFAPAP